MLATFRPVIQSVQGRTAVVSRYMLSSRPSQHLAIPCLIASDVEIGLGVHEQSNNETVETQDFGENENQDHSDEQTGLLSSSADTGVSNNTDSETSSKTSETNGETSTELNKASVEGKILLKTVGNQDGDDQAVDTNDTSHNDGDDVLDDEVGAENTHSSNTDTGLGGTVRGTQAGEDDSAGATHGTEEGRVNRAVFGNHLDCLKLSKREIRVDEKISMQRRERSFGDCDGGGLGDGAVDVGA